MKKLLLATVIALTPFTASAASIIGSGMNTWNGPAGGFGGPNDRGAYPAVQYLANKTTYYRNPVTLPADTKAKMGAAVRAGRTYGYVYGSNGLYIRSVLISDHGTPVAVLPGNGVYWSNAVTGGASSTFRSATVGGVVHNKDGTTTRYVPYHP